MSVRRPRGRVLPVNAVAGDHTIASVDLDVPARVLAVGAHPDDIEFGAAGTLAKWASQGTVLHHLVLTDGSKGSWEPERDLAALVAERQEEQRAAARAVGGGDVTFLGHVDGELRNDLEVQREVARCIRTIRPDVVLTHDPWRRYRLHPDHRHAGFIVTDTLVAARDPHFFAELGLEPHRPTALLLWEADQANHVENVDGFVAAKVDALLAHRSQHETTMGVTDDSGTAGFVERVREQLAAHGALAGLDCGESFHLLTDI